jgi:hypothetical protein
MFKLWPSGLRTGLSLLAIMLAIGLATLGLSATVGAVPASAGPAVQVASAVRVNSAVALTSNGCHLPTSAGSGSGYSGSYSGCVDCSLDAAADTLGGSTVYYCTYNPSNGLTDLHYGSTASHCHLPTSAGAGSAYTQSYSNCRTCAVAAANNTRSIGNPYVWYCTYHPANGLTDEHHS